jgi:hypothetical protein
MTTSEEVREWVLEVVEQGADRIELRAKHDDARVREWAIAANDTSDKPAAEKLADQIAREATRDGACQSGSTIVYVVFAFRGENERYIARLLVQVEGRSKRGGGSMRDDEPESANVHGLLSMMMKHHGELHRLLIMSQEGRAEADARTIDRMLEQLNQHEMKRAALLEMYEKLQSMQMERERARVEMKLSEERQKYVASKIDMLFPIAMNRLLGGGPGKGTPFFGEEMVRQIMGNIKPDEVDAFMRTTNMRPELQALFTELYLSYWNKEQARKAAEEKATAEANGATSAAEKGEPS